MRRLFARNSIRGVTTHRRSYGASAKRDYVKLSTLDTSPFQITKKMLQEGKPAELCSIKIRALLLDTPRHEIHALVSEAIEHLSHWKQLLHALESYLARKGSLELYLENSAFEDEDLEPNEQHNFALDVRANFQLWKHRLAVLELIADAQHCIGHEHLLKANAHVSHG